MYKKEEIKNKVSLFIKNNDKKGAYNFYKELYDIVEKNNLKIRNYDLYKTYSYYLDILSFFSLRFFDDWDFLEKLIKNHFELVFEIDSYDFYNELKLKLLVVYDFDERDGIKKSLIKTLFECQRPILEKNKYIQKNIPITVKDWLNDYFVYLQENKPSTAKRVEYMVNFQKNKKLEKEDAEKIKKLIIWYEKLSASSSRQKGYEGDLLIRDKNGKLLIMSDGELREISKETIESLKQIKIDSDTENTKTTELKEDLKNFKPGSLEYKTIEEEIEKLTKENL